jgi:transcriptional regulator with GAF, ATPase, and Fis domain
MSTIPPHYTSLDAASAIAEILWLAQQPVTSSDYLNSALGVAARICVGDYHAWARAAGGQWIAVAESGSSRPLPRDLLADAMDRETSEYRDGWLVAPAIPPGGVSEALLIHAAADLSLEGARHQATAMAHAIAESCRHVAGREDARRRIDRLQSILDIARRWSQTRETEPLLRQIAEAATRLLDADRASIFLWDRRTRTLVGRPALGIERGELRVPDDRGVVGRVVQTGRSCRVDSAIQPELIDRNVDAQWRYQTKTILCVPLRNRAGEVVGAFELLNKHCGPFTDDDETVLADVAVHAAIALENARDRETLASDNVQLAQQAADQIRLVGRSQPIEALRSILKRVAETELAVLILGENGTGKEVVAQSLHYLSPRRNKPFVAVNCAAIPDTLAESELFGHEKGAFTDAHQARPGKFELAASGTLFLDEIGDLSLAGQAKLLRVLEERLLVRVGGSTPIPTDARVVAATNQNLVDMVRQKKFREDLFFRLNVVAIEIPPLRERREDILLLAEHFLGDFCRKARRPMLAFSDAAKLRLEGHPWPGNVRELRNLLERLAYLSSSDIIDVGELASILTPRGAAALAAPGSEQSLTAATEQFQIEFIRREIERSNGNLSQASAQLGLHRSNLYRKMRQLGMPVPK